MKSPPPPARNADIVTIGRMVDASALAEAVAVMLSRDIRPARCWGSGTGGAPLAVANFIGTDETAIRELGRFLRSVSGHRSPLKALRRTVTGSTLTRTWIDDQLVAWFDAQSVVSDFASMTVEDTNQFDDHGTLLRPADWLQLVALDLELRRPVTLPAFLDEIGGRYSQDFRLAELLAFAMAGLDGPPPAQVLDRYGRGHELTQYPGFRSPWAIDRRHQSWPIIVIVPDEDTRSTSSWWGTPVDKMLVPAPPANCLVIEVPAHPDKAAEHTAVIIDSALAALESTTADDSPSIHPDESSVAMPSGAIAT